MKKSGIIKVSPYIQEKDVDLPVDIEISGIQMKADKDIDKGTLSGFNMNPGLEFILKSAPLAFLVLIFLMTSCKKNNNNIPDVYIDQYLYLSQPSNVNLNAIGGFIYLNNVGARGLIVYRKSLNEFVALDRNCTYDPNESCATVAVDNTNFFAEDTCCHSKFQINNGQVVNGPASLPLKSYQTEFDGVSVVHIFN